MAQQQQAEEEALRAAKAQKEKDNICQEECKKNQSKFLPIPDQPVPQRALVITTQSAMWHIDKGECVPLLYYTNKGLENALTLLHYPDSSTLLIPASSTKESRGIIDNQDIKWDNFCIAAPQMIEAIGRANWPHNHIQIMVNFWVNLQEHPFCSSSVPFEQKSLLVYQAEQRRLWHIAIVDPHARYNLSTINEALLRDTKEQLFWEDCSWIEVEHKSLVSLSFSPP